MNPDKSKALRPTRDAVIADEFAWHEQEAHRRYPLDTFLYDPPVFDQVVDSGFAFLETRPHELVLDIGCGEGKESLRLAAQGSWVISTDLSRTQLSRARQYVQEHCPHAQIAFVQANAEALPFASEAFGAIYGKAILHHLDLDAAAYEVKRLLRQQGRATFAEPMASHPLFWLARRFTPQLRTKNEAPWAFAMFSRFAALFTASEFEAYFLVTPFIYPFRLLPGGEPLFRRLLALVQCLDSWLFRHCTSLRKLAWYGLVKVSK